MRTTLTQARLRLAAVGLEQRTTWIFGSPRSGTTWLGALLARTMNATVIDEPLIGAHLATPVAAVTSIRDEAEALLYEADAGRPAYFFCESARAAWEPALRTLVLRRFAAAALESPLGPRAPLVVKEPNGSLAAPVLARALPRSRVLFVVRDGRDVIDSILDGAAGGWITNTHGVSVEDLDQDRFLEHRARQWVRTIETVAAAYRSHPADRRLRLKYEDLLSAPEAELERVLTWLDQPVDGPEVASAVEALSFKNLPEESKGPGRFARSASPGSWRHHLRPEMQVAVTQIMGPMLEELGYATD